MFEIRGCLFGHLVVLCSQKGVPDVITPPGRGTPRINHRVGVDHEERRTWGG